MEQQPLASKAEQGLKQPSNWSSEAVAFVGLAKHGLLKELEKVGKHRRSMTRAIKAEYDSIPSS